MGLGIFEKLPKLERLYLGEGLELGGLGFLRKTPGLKELQIQAQRRQSTQAGGLDALKSLEFIRFFDPPDPISIQELATLKNLETVEIVGDEFVVVDPKIRRNLESQLPGVEIHLIDRKEFVPDPESPLERYRESVRQRLLDAL